jgi:hypothetical protein
MSYMLAVVEYFSTSIFVLLTKLYALISLLSCAHHDHRNLPRRQCHLSVLPAAIAAATCAMGQRYGNPSSSHAAGLSAKALLDQARQCARRLLGVGEGRLMFNSGATEGIQTAVLSALVALRERRERARPSAACWSTAPPNTRPCRKVWRTGTVCWA